MKKILFLIPTLSAGGAEKVLINLVNHMDFSRYDVTVQTIVDRGVYKEALRPEIHYKSMVSSDKAAYLVQFVLPPSMVYNRYIANKSAPYDVEIAFLEGSAAKLLSGSTNKKAKKLAWIHTDLSTLDENKKVFPREKKAIACYGKFDQIVCVSRDVRAGFIKKYGMEDRTVVCYNAIDDALVREMAKVPVTLPHAAGIRLVAVGRLVPLKGYDRLLNVLHRLKEEGFSFLLYLIGDGPERERLIQQAQALCLLDCVFFMGYCENPYPYMQQAQLFVCSSQVEGFSTAATEAIVLGVPVVTTDCAGMRDLLGDNEYGMIVENSEEGLYKGLRAYFRNRAVQDQYRQKTQLRAKEFQIEKRMEALEALF